MRLESSELTGRLSRQVNHSYHELGEWLGVLRLKKCVDAVRAYFETKNKVWVTGDFTGLVQTAQVAPSADWWKYIVRGIQAKQRDMKHRRSKLLRAHARVSVRELNERTDKCVHVKAEEHITWVYRDGREYGVEARVILHRQRWARRGNHWILQTAWESDECVVPVEESVHEPPGGVTRTRLASLRDVAAKNCVKYDRVRALRYAELWWNGCNPSFPKLADDCTNFVSQCLWAGNMPMRDGAARTSGWWYKFGTHPGDNWSYSWTTSHALYLHLMHKMNASRVQSPRELRIGDLVFYDWDGTGRFHHTTMVSDFDNTGDPLVNAHSDDSYHRHYLYLDSRAWTPKTKYAFVHVPDVIC